MSVDSASVRTGRKYASSRDRRSLGIAPSRQQPPLADDLRQPMPEDRTDEAFLRAEVVVDGRVVRRPGLGRDLPERDAVDPVEREQPLGGDDDPQRAGGWRSGVGVGHG